MSKTTTSSEQFTVTGTGRKWFVVVDGVRDQSLTYRSKTEATQAAADMAAAAKKAERAAKRAAKKSPVAEAPAAVDYSTLSKVELLKLAKAERAAKKAGEPPPVLDWMAGGGAVAKKATKSTGGSFRSAEQEAQMVAILTAGIAEGKSWAKIALDLDAAAIPTRSGGRWWDATAHSTAQRLGLHTVKPRQAAA